MKRIRQFLVVVLAFLILGQSHVSAQSNPEITASELQKHVKFLASDQLQGRRIGTKGADEAATYIAGELQAYGLKPIGDSGTYFQNFDFIAGVKLGKGNKLAAAISGKSKSYVVDKDFRPLGFSSNESFEGGLVFAGYGISDTSRQYDDYENIDVKGKAVIVLQNAPPSDSGRNLSQYSSLRYKASKAREMGAKAMIVVTGPEDSDKDDLIKLSYDNSSGGAGLPALNMTRKTADELLFPAGRTIRELQMAINQTKKPKSIAVTNVSLSLTVDLNQIHGIGRNVVGMLEGSDASLKDQIMVFGAHYDHLGMGGAGSLRPDTLAVHHGADDNASGTSGVLELAQYFASKKGSLKRSMVFVAFSGEEEGLLGSGYYVNHPIIPLDRTVAMLNMDMIGRLTNRTLIVYGVGTSSGFESLAKKFNADSTFILKLNRDGFGPSDHAAFYGKKIPVFNFFTDIHSDYHRPSDTYDKLNYGGMESIVRYAQAIAEEINQTNEPPKYVAVEMPRQQMGGRSPRVSMGTVPDFGGDAQGYKLSGVREGSPAAKAGMVAGDIIIKLGKMEVKNIYDFTYALGEFKPGDEVDVVIRRGNEEKTLHVKLEKGGAR